MQEINLHSILEKILHIKSPFKNNNTILYEYFIFSVIATLSWVYIEIKLAIDSQNFAKKHHFLLSGLTSRKTYFSKYRDFSDFQYSSFRDNLSIIIIFSSIFLAVSHAIKHYVKKVHILIIFYLTSGMGYAYFLHGNKFFFLFISVTLSFLLTKLYHHLGSKTYVFLTWFICIIIRFSSEIYSGFSFSMFGLDIDEDEMINWRHCYNLIMLRAISFNLEYKNEVEENSENNKYINIGEHCEDCNKGNYCLTGLKYVKCTTNNFTFANYLGYIFYPPLYISGPTIIFNSFIYQVNNFEENKHNKFNDKTKIKYFLRLIFVFLVLEVFNHYIYVNCYLTNDFNRYRIEEFNYSFLASLTFNNLTFIYLKFTFIWRIARTWSWFDGVLTEENMNRCVYNNYCFEGFWRAWHRSFNIWLIRYIYIPLGGSKKKIFNVWVVFSFVALWHDLKLNLLIWGWFICIFMIPEIIVKNYFNSEKMRYLHEKFSFRMLQYIFCAVYILLMITANLIGFGMGSKGLLMILRHLYEKTSLFYFIKILFFFVPLSAMMFYIREYEKQVYGKEKVKY